MTNEILDDTINGQTVKINTFLKVQDKPQCIMCEFVMKQLEDELKDAKNEVNIENELEPQQMGRYYFMIN